MSRSPANSEGLSCRLLRADERVVFASLQGHIRLEETPILRDLMNALADQPAELFYIDVAGIGYIDSTGLGLLMALHREIHSRGRKLFLVEPSKTIFSVLRLSKLDQIFHIVPPEEADDLRHRLLEANLGEKTD